MKFLGLLILFLYTAVVNAATYTHDKTGVTFHFEYNDSVFPSSWLEGRVKGQAASLDSAEIPRTIKMLETALSKYPEGFVARHLSNIYVFSKLQFFGVGYGGTYYKDAIFLTNKGEAKGYSDKFMEKVFHAEFSSILFTRYKSLFPSDAWGEANGSGFEYGSGGVDAIRNGTNDESLLEEHHRAGFITEYGMSDMENDLNSFAKHIFGDPEAYWKLVNEYPRIKQKSSLVIRFYSKISAEFSEEYFRRL